jgi:hypothetical protein
MALITAPPGAVGVKALHGQSDVNWQILNYPTFMSGVLDFDQIGCLQSRLKFYPYRHYFNHVDSGTDATGESGGAGPYAPR